MAHKDQGFKEFKPLPLQELISQDWKPFKIQFKAESIIEATEQAIFNGIHTVTKQHDNPVVKTIFKQFPYADCYKTRTSRVPMDPPGTIKIFGDGSPKEKFIINMFIQERPGLSKSTTDNLKNRLKFFEQAFEKAYSTAKFESAAFSELIAGETYYQGNFWQKYLEIMFKCVKKYPKVRTVMYLGDRTDKFPSKIIKFD